MIKIKKFDVLFIIILFAIFVIELFNNDYNNAIISAIILGVSLIISKLSVIHEDILKNSQIHYIIDDISKDSDLDKLEELLDKLKKKAN